MVMPQRTKQQDFQQQFMLTLRFLGQTFNSIDELTAFLKDNTSFQLFDFQEKPEESIDRFKRVHEPFSYVIARIGSNPYSFPQKLGFKVAAEPIYRIGPPHFEATNERVSFGTLDGFRLYESPEKNYHLLTETKY
jgi:hypothetical protein